MCVCVYNYGSITRFRPRNDSFVFFCFCEDTLCCLTSSYRTTPNLRVVIFLKKTFKWSCLPAHGSFYSTWVAIKHAVNSPAAHPSATTASPYALHTLHFLHPFFFFVNVFLMTLPFFLRPPVFISSLKNKTAVTTLSEFYVNNIISSTFCRLFHSLKTKTQKSHLLYLHHDMCPSEIPQSYRRAFISLTRLTLIGFKHGMISLPSLVFTASIFNAREYEISTLPP